MAVDQEGNAQANMGLALGDYNHSGRFSIAVTHFNAEYAALYRNDGTMNFTDVSFASGIARSTTPYVGWGDGFFDFDNDGWSDFFMVNGHVYPQIDSIGMDSKYPQPKLLFQNLLNEISKISASWWVRRFKSRGSAEEWRWETCSTTGESILWLKAWWEAP